MAAKILTASDPTKSGQAGDSQLVGVRGLAPERVVHRSVSRGAVDKAPRKL